MTILREEEGNPVYTPFANKIPITGYGKQEIVNLCVNSQGLNYTETILYTEGGDLIHANSDFINNRFACIICGREFLETQEVP